MLNKKHISFCVILFAAKSYCQKGIDSSGVTANTFFQASTFCKTFVSEVENCQTKIELDYATNCSDYDLSESHKAYKVFQTTSLGLDFPIYSKYISKNNKPIYGIGFSAPISFHLWWDPFEASTSPILNMDYRFGTVNFKFIRFFKNKTFKNISLKLAPFNHESTHIGDELTTFRKKEKFPITRVNVSYEYSEFNVTLNDPNSSSTENHALRFGMRYRLNGSQDFYTMTSLDGDSTLIKPTGLKSEFYLEYQWNRTKGPLTNSNWMNVISFELRNRVIYNYPTYSLTGSGMECTNISSSRANSLNLYFGWKYNRSQCPTIGLYLHAYVGLNPNGQFRNHDGFKSIGFSLVLE